jgi:hypothetical protein
MTDTIHKGSQPAQPLGLASTEGLGGISQESEMDEQLDEAISAALALGQLMDAGTVRRVSGADFDRILMARELARLREASRAASGAADAATEPAAQQRAGE